MGETISDAVRRVLVEHLGVNRERVSLASSLIDDLGADSLDCIELTMAMEEEFNISIDDERAERLVTVGDVVSLVTEMRRHSAA